MNMWTYEHVDRIFYLNEDLTEITEDTLRIITSREKTASKISGFIFVWYCIECKEFIYEYDITDNSSDKSIEQIEELIYDITDNSSDKSIEQIEELIREISPHENVIFSSSIENTFRKCPICYRKIDSVWNYGKCPACEIGELHLLDKFIFD